MKFADSLPPDILDRAYLQDCLRKGSRVALKLRSKYIVARSSIAYVGSTLHRDYPTTIEKRGQRGRMEYRKLPPPPKTTAKTTARSVLRSLAAIGGKLDSLLVRSLAERHKVKESSIRSMFSRAKSLVRHDEPVADTPVIAAIKELS